MTRLLIIDDEPIAVKNLAYALRKSGYSVTTRESGSGGYDVLGKESFDVVLTDLRMDRVDGMAILKRARELDPDVAVIVITAHGTSASVVDAMKAGAFHYVDKPFRLDEVRELVKNAADLVALKRENKKLRNQVYSNQNESHFITQDPATQRLLDTARQIAVTNTSVLINGESGTGKELLARFIHHHSTRSQAPFVAVNCGALQEELLANELFGHARGAYTGANEARAGLIEAADGGTLFLDEIAEMSTAMQVKLLRVIQEREVQRLGATTIKAVDIRIIAATHRDLSVEVAAGKFRQDLYYRLDVISLKLPPLASRKHDIPLLAYYFLRKHMLRIGRNVRDIQPQAIALLMDYDYPGNVRELENIIERGVALANGEELTVSDLPKTLSDHAVHVVRESADKLPTLERREEDYIRYVMQHCGGSRTRAAEILGIDRVSLWRKLKKYNMA